MADNWHVVPSNDLIQHNTEGMDCECNPRIQKQPNGAYVITHHSWDGREAHEEDNPRRVH